MTTEIKCRDFPVHAVTVYNSSKAEAVRLLPIHLKSGTNTIKLTYLPATLDTKSIRLSGFGDARLQDVVCLINDKKRPAYNDSSEILSNLQSQRARVSMECESIHNGIKALLDYSRSLKAEHLSPSDLDLFMNVYTQHNQKNREALAEVDNQLKILDAKIALEDEKASRRKGPRLNGEITIVVSSDLEHDMTLRLTYVVTDATWRPTYELHASTVDGKPGSTVTLSYRADITQSTGEDWKDASLTLSTYNTSLNTNIPRLFPLKIRPKQRFPTGGLFSNNMQVHSRAAVPGAQASLFGAAAATGNGTFGTSGFGALQAQQQQQAAGALFGSAVPQAQLPTAPTAPEAEDDFVLADNEVEVAQKPGTVIKDSALAVTYSVDGQSTIPSDGIAHMVNISELEFECKIKHIAVPRVESMVYLQCQVKNTSEFRLLPGRVGVILDGSFVSQTFIREVPAGETFTCTLGADPATKISYSRQIVHSDIKANAFAEGKKTTTYTVNISITNKHPFPLDEVVVREALPLVDLGTSSYAGSSFNNVQGGSKAQVVLKKPLGLAEAKMGDVFSLEGTQIEKDALKAEGIKVRWSKPEIGGTDGSKEGMFEWFGAIAPKEAVVLQAEWDVKAPEDVKWVEVIVR